MDFNSVTKNKTHEFQAESLLVPGTNMTNGNRLQMFNSHISQAIQLAEAEPPLVHTGFENQVGSYSTGFKKIEGNWKILKKIEKNKYNYILVVQNEDTGEYDILYRTPGTNLTEHFGATYNNDVMDSFEEEETIKEDTILYRDKNYDEDMNFQYGRNLNAAYIPFKG